MYYSKTAALDRHVCELHRIITKVEPKAPQKNASTENKCKMSKRELNNRIERLVLLAYTLRRKTTNEPFVPATEQEWAHLYMNGMCVKKYYTCQGRQVYVPKKIEDSTKKGCRNRSDKYNTYLTDCGAAGSGGGSGKGYGGGGGNLGGGGGSGGGGEPISNYLTFIVTITAQITTQQVLEIEKMVRKDIEIFNDKSKKAFFPDSGMKITYENLLFIIGLILGLNMLISKEENAKLIYNLSKKTGKSDQENKTLETYKNNGLTLPTENQFKKIESNLAEYNELFDKAKNKFEELRKKMPQNEVRNKKGKSENEITFIIGILEIFAFADDDNSEGKKDTFERFKGIEENAQKENLINQEHPGTGDLYVIILPEFLKMFYKPQPFGLFD